MIQPEVGRDAFWFFKLTEKYFDLNFITDDRKVVWVNIIDEQFQIVKWRSYAIVNLL